MTDCLWLQHDRWTIHGTLANERREKRRGWALHYADARSKWGDHGIALRDGTNIVDHDDLLVAKRFHARNKERSAPESGSHTQWRGYNFIGGKLNGNREDVLVCGRSHEGCI